MAWYIWFWVPAVFCHLTINHHVDHLAWQTSGQPLENGCSVGVHCRHRIEPCAPLCFESFYGVDTQDLPHCVVCLVLGPDRVLPSSHQPSCWPFGMTDFRLPPWKRLRRGGALSVQRRAVCTFMFWIFLRCWHPRHATSRGIFGIGSGRCFAIWPSTIMLTIWHDWLPASPSTTATSWGCTVGAAQSRVRLYVSNLYTVFTPKTCHIAWYISFWVPTVSCHLAINHHVDHLAWLTSGRPLENGCSVGVHCWSILEPCAPLSFESFCGIDTQDMPHRVVYLVLGPGRVLPSSHQPSCWPFGMTDFRPAPGKRLRCGGALLVHRRAVCIFIFWIPLRCWHPRHATSRGIFGFGSRRCFAIWLSTIMLTIWHDWLPASPSKTASTWGCTVGIA